MQFVALGRDDVDVGLEVEDATQQALVGAEFGGSDAPLEHGGSEPVRQQTQLLRHAAHHVVVVVVQSDRQRPHFDDQTGAGGADAVLAQVLLRFRS